MRPAAAKVAIRPSGARVIASRPCQWYNSGDVEVGRVIKKSASRHRNRVCMGVLRDIVLVVVIKRTCILVIILRDRCHIP